MVKMRTDRIEETVMCAMHNLREVNFTEGEIRLAEKFMGQFLTLYCIYNTSEFSFGDIRREVSGVKNHSQLKNLIRIMCKLDVLRSHLYSDGNWMYRIPDPTIQYYFGEDS